MSKEKWKTLLNLIVTIITAIAASLTTDPWITRTQDR